MAEETEGQAPRNKKRREPKHRFYVIYSPEGESPPKAIHETHPNALAIAWMMAKRNPGKTFFVMGSMSRPCVVDPDALTGCADDQTYADVSVDAVRAVLDQQVSA